MNKFNSDPNKSVHLSSQAIDLYEAIDRYPEINIVGQKRKDLDSLCSCLALVLWIIQIFVFKRSKYRRINVYNWDDKNEFLNSVKNTHIVGHDVNFFTDAEPNKNILSEEQTTILLDMSEESEISNKEENTEYFLKYPKKLFCLDDSDSNEFWQLRDPICHIIQDETASSTCEILYKFFRCDKFYDPIVDEVLLHGIYYDSCNLTSVKNWYTFRIISEICARGIHFPNIIKNQYSGDIAQRRFMSHLWKHAEAYKNNLLILRANPHCAKECLPQYFKAKKIISFPIKEAFLQVKTKIMVYVHYDQYDPFCDNPNRIKNVVYVVYDPDQVSEEFKTLLESEELGFKSYHQNKSVAILSSPDCYKFLNNVKENLKRYLK